MPSPLPTSLFDYSLPDRLIAQVPAARRDASRLLVVDRKGHRISHHHFSDLPGFLTAGDILFRNTAAVLPARLRAQRPTGGQVECFLLRPEGRDDAWRCLVKPGRRLQPGSTFTGPEGAFVGEIISKADDGSALVAFKTDEVGGITAVAKRLGEIPLPPYIQRSQGAGPECESDKSRYQTVYADPARSVAVAAPTAGLHFTPELLATLRGQGVGFRDVTLHVGMGTFKPIATETVEEHPIHRELYEMPGDTQRSLFPPLAGRRIAVGTTTVRSVEDFLRTHDAPRDGPHIAEAGLYLYPPCTFRGVDALITNFHQPRSTLLCLVSAFLAPGSTDGIPWLMEIYKEAISMEYRFFSYGDAMLII